MPFALSLVVSLASAQATFDGSTLTVNLQHSRQLPAEVDVLTVQLTASDPREWDAAVHTVDDAEQKVRKVIEKEAPGAQVRLIAESATLNPPTGSCNATLEVRLPIRVQNQLLLSRLGMIRGVSAITLTHDLSDRQRALSELRKEAFGLAKTKADDYATALGRKLGKTLLLQEGGESLNTPYAAMFLTGSTSLVLKFAVE